MTSQMLIKSNYSSDVIYVYVGEYWIATERILYTNNILTAFIESAKEGDLFLPIFKYFFPKKTDSFDSLIILLHTGIGVSHIKL